jgi:FkbM family methyltransferase
MGMKKSCIRADLAMAGVFGSILTVIMMTVVFPSGRSCDLTTKTHVTKTQSDVDQSEVAKVSGGGGDQPAAKSKSSKSSSKSTAVVAEGNGKQLARKNEKFVLPDDYEAANPRFTAICKELLTKDESHPFVSQHRQDWFIYHNFYYGDRRQQGTGFYVDVGTNDAKVISNTFFFDNCLGWQGLCVEPNPKYHPDIEKDRSCKLIPHCVWDADKSLKFWMGGVTSRIVPLDFKGRKSKFHKEVRCLPLDKILKDNDVKKIDFFSLDAEEAESQILSVFPYSDYDIRVWVVEHNDATDLLKTDEVARLMKENGFRKLHHSSMRNETRVSEMDDGYNPILMLDDVYINEKAENTGVMPISEDEALLIPPNHYMSTYRYSDKGQYQLYHTNCNWPCKR